MIGVVGDVHFKNKLSYSDLLSAGRQEEEKEILDFIASSLAPCDKIVFMGDLLNGKNNGSEVLRKMVEFLERFDGKDLYLVCGNHEKTGNGDTALDFLSEVKGHKWKAVLRGAWQEGSMTFLPYMTFAELGVPNGEAAREKLLAQAGKNDILFTHYAITNFRDTSGRSTDEFDGVVFPREELEKRFSLVVSGHVHKPQCLGRTLITGSVFNNEVGETQKYIWKINEENLKIESIKLPGRGIYKLENPLPEELEKITDGNIVKVILDDPAFADKTEAIREELKRFDAFALVERFPHQRQKMTFDLEKGILEMSTEELLEIYCQQKKIESKNVMKIFESIK